MSKRLESRVLRNLMLRRGPCQNSWRLPLPIALTAEFREQAPPLGNLVTGSSQVVGELATVLGGCV